VRAQAGREAQEARWIGKALDDLGDRVRYVKAHFVSACGKRPSAWDSSSRWTT
jgi:hypothetical protein